VRFGLFGINFGACADPAALVARAAAIGVDRLIVFPLVPASELETTVRALGATLAGAGRR